MNESVRDVLVASSLAADDEVDFASAWHMLFENGQTEHDGDCTKKAHTCPLCLVANEREWADRFRAAIATAGYAVVPVEPTEAMLAAATEVEFVPSDGDDKWLDTLSDLAAEEVYRAMLAAASKP